MRVFFVERQELAPGIWQFAFRPEAPLHFEPGQYADLRLGVERARTFTLTSLPEEPLITFVAKIPSPMSAYKNALLSLQPGAFAELTEPMGDFILPKSPRIPLIFVAGGIGIASYVSIARWLEHAKQQRPITAFYSVRSKSEIILQNELGPAVQPQIITAPQRLTPENILQAAEPQSLIYLSGSQTFVEATRAELLKRGIEPYRIIFEYYTGYLEL